MRERILAAIRTVPRGYVSTYGAIAKAAGYPGAARQVVRALHTGVDLPWQRIVGAGGEIKLQGDSAFDQRLRLEMEGVTFRGPRVNLQLHEYHFPKPTRKPARKRKSKPGQGKRKK
jgi:methylated-DNA-protein-cysteine methyltransferase-like protein